MDPAEKDFLLALYGKLWDNINARSTRLWTLLSVYAGAVGLALGATQIAAAGLYASIVLVLFSWWPLFLTLNATWLDRQNRLYMDRIEDKFSEILRGILPAETSARTPPFDPTNQILVSGVAFLIYFKSLWPFLSPSGITSFEQCVLLCVLALATLAGPWWWLAKSEALHAQYTDIFRELQGTVLIDLKAVQAERRAVPWRWFALVFFVFVLFTYDTVLAWNTKYDALGAILLCVSVALQLAAILLFAWLAVQYYRPSTKASELEPPLSMARLVPRLILSSVLAACLCSVAAAAPTRQLVERVIR